MRIKKQTTMAIAGLAAVAIAGGSLAYWNQTSTIDNPFDTSSYGSTVVEDFSPSDGEDWQPGVEVNKDVTAVNTGDTDLIVRVRLDETWTRKGETTAYKDSNDSTSGYDVYVTNQIVADDGLTADDGSVVIKNFATETNWIDGGDGWYYYAINLAGGETSDKWLDSVELLDDADMGKMKTTYYVTTEETVTANTVWYEYDGTGEMPAYLDANGNACDASAQGAAAVRHNKTEVTYNSDSEVGYSNSDYNLKVTVQTVQATQEAIDAVFGDGSAFTAPEGTNWVVK